MRNPKMAFRRGIRFSIPAFYLLIVKIAESLASTDALAEPFLAKLKK
jgi:hypothetical protein